jgi:hypothetical protein
MNKTKSIQKGVWLAIVLGLKLTTATTYAADGVFVESPEFSGNSASPTPILPSLQLGTNTIQGFVDSSQWGTDHDYFRVTLPANGRLASVRVKITGFRAEPGSFGVIEVLPSQLGNTGNANITGNMNFDLGFAIGTSTNIVFHLAAPFIYDFGATASFNYQLELLVSPVEVIAGTGIRTAVEVTFPTETNGFYQVQCTSDLEAGNWINLGQAIRGTGAMQSAFDTTRNSNQQFYRVVRQ